MTQKDALKILKTGANVFLTGEPGSGKTHLVNTYVEYLRSHAIEPAITASTGIAATHIGGMTIHSWSGIGIARELSPHDLARIAEKSYLTRRIKKTSVLIIDEISMLDAQTLSLVETVIKKVRKNELPFGGLQVVLVGDFFQLPPVTKESKAVNFAFQSESWINLNPAVCYITEQHRQNDRKFLSVLNSIRSDNFQEVHFTHIESRLTSKDQIPDDITKLFSHNINVDKVNDNELAKLPAKDHKFEMSDEGPKKLTETLKKGCLSPENLKLKIGAAVMFTKNSPREGFVNGTLGKVIDFDMDSGYPIVQTRNGKNIEAEPMDWTVEENGFVRAKITQIPLRLAWAITIHKSQGMSLDAAVMDLSSVFEYGQGYVALSRVRNLSGLHLLGINNHALLVHPDILNKDKEFRRQSGKSESEFEKIKNEKLEKRFDQFIFTCNGTLEKVEPKKAKFKEKKESTQDETLKLFKDGKSIAEIAKTRGLTEGTVLGHLEQLVNKDRLDIKDLIPLISCDLKTELAIIHNTFRSLDTDKLSEVYHRLNGAYSYNDLRLARMLME